MGKSTQSTSQSKDIHGVFPAYYGGAKNISTYLIVFPRFTRDEFPIMLCHTRSVPFTLYQDPYLH